MTGCKQPRKLLECTEDYLLMQEIDELTRGHALLDPLTTNKEKIIENVKVIGQSRLQQP